MIALNSLNHLTISKIFIIKQQTLNGLLTKLVSSELFKLVGLEINGQTQQKCRFSKDSDQTRQKQFSLVSQ